jgi:hypothetical protein
MKGRPILPNVMSPHRSRHRRLFFVCCTVVAVGVAVSLLWFIPPSYKFYPLVEVVVDDTPSAAFALTVDGSETKLPPSAFGRGTDWRGFHESRSIAFVHLGKAGGVTVRSSTRLVCGVQKQSMDCIDSRFPSNAVLSRQVKYYLHMYGYRPGQMEQATSYLIALRNPVDRLISSYRYSHPANCRGDLRGSRIRPYGCYLEAHAKTPGRTEWRVHTRCFPSAGMEDFAQAVLSPYPYPFNVSHLSNQPLDFQEATPAICRALAHRMVRGVGPWRPNPHMYYNYDYYMERTVRLHPEKEVFGMRTEHEWEDLTDLDKAIGGTGIFREQGKHESHGSEAYLPSPLTTEAYYKLCCVLEQEIAFYQELILRVQNFNDTVKQEALDSVRKKCGMGSMAFEEWRAECQAKIEQDRSIWFKPGLEDSKQLNATPHNSTANESETEESLYNHRNDMASQWWLRRQPLSHRLRRNKQEYDTMRHKKLPEREQESVKDDLLSVR